MPEGYFDDREEFDEIYERKRRESRLESLEEPREREREVVEIKKPVHRAMPRLEETTIESLKRVSPQIIGGLFERLEFLRERIEEVRDNIAVREELHKETISEIDRDIEEKEEMSSRLTDVDEIRNFKLDISILRKEKRHENVQFWRDILELRTELRDLMEKYEAEKKIVEIFKELGGRRE
mgnify:CR=1 FL=1